MPAPANRNRLSAPAHGRSPAVKLPLDAVAVVSDLRPGRSLVGPAAREESARLLRVARAQRVKLPLPWRRGLQACKHGKARLPYSHRARILRWIDESIARMAARRELEAKPLRVSLLPGQGVGLSYTARSVPDPRTSPSAKGKAKGRPATG